MLPGFRSALAILLLAPCVALGAPAITLKRVATGFSAPVDIAHAGDGSGRLFIVQQTGQVRILAGAQVLATPFLDIASLIESGGERGLLGIAFHPSYSSNGFFYVNYTRAGDGATVIARYTRSPANSNIADPGSAMILLSIPQPFENHNGGQLRFGPDGFLYIGMGDGGSGNDPGNRAQSLNTLLGKMLRIDVNSSSPYAIPASNPFQNDGDPDTRGEIWAFGLRNPWRFSFDRLTGDLFIADVGQNAWEEVNFQANGIGGRNYGWRVMEGNHCTGLAGGPPCFASSLTAPILEYEHSQGCSITGGFRYRGAAVPALAGHYIYGDFCSGRIWGGTRDQSGLWSAAELLETDLSISTFGEDQAGEIYVADRSAGVIYRIVGTDPWGRRDFNADGKADVLWRQTSTGVVSIWLMNGGVIQSFAGGWSVPPDWVIQQVADFNGDGKADILWRQASTGLVSIWLMNGGAIQSFAGGWRIPPDWVIQQVADFNGDGKADIFWWQDGTGLVSIWLMDGGVIQSFAGGWSIPADWLIQQVGDFNGDGKADILWRQRTGLVLIWLMNGGAIQSVTGGWSIPADWVIQQVGDFNGDGKADILWRQSSTGLVSIWLMNSRAIQSFAGGWSVPADWLIQQVSDFNGDGKADILWRQSSTGLVLIWLMSSGAIQSIAGGWSIPADWVIHR